MNKAFTNEDDGGIEALLELPQSPHPNYVTPAGLTVLEQRLSQARIRLAELHGRKNDVDKQLPIAIAERDIRYLEERLKRAIPIDPRAQPPGIVAFGAAVEVIEGDDARRTYRIVGEDEADPSRGLITPFSPLARALIGARVGDVVSWERPKGPIDLEVTAIRFS